MCHKYGQSPPRCGLCALLLRVLWISGCLSNRTRAAKSELVLVSELLENLLKPSVYNSRMRPGADYGKPLLVNVSLFVSDIYRISEAAMEYSVTFYLRQRWLDERLVFNMTSYNRSITLNYNQFDKVWTPDVFIRNLKSGYQHQITVPNRLLRIFPDGTLLFSQRLSVTLSCDMHLEKYPLDNQTCHLNFGSYAYTTADIVLVWDIQASGGKPVEVNPRITFPKFLLRKVTFSSCQVSYVTTGAYPCLEAFFHLDRRLRSYIFYVYLPSLLIVILSWLSFWIDLHAVPARISLGILTILTMATQNTNLNSDMPTMSITKALDVWMFVCMVFVFAAFLEYSVVNVLARRGRKRLYQERLCRGPTHRNNMGFCDADVIHHCEDGAGSGRVGPIRLAAVSVPGSGPNCEPRGRSRRRDTVSAMDQTGSRTTINSHLSHNAGSDHQRPNQQQVTCCCHVRCRVSDECRDQEARSASVPDCTLNKDATNAFCGCCVPDSSAHFVDKICRYVFPALFSVFNIAYWIAYN